MLHMQNEEVSVSKWLLFVGDGVEVEEHRVTVCRDAAKGQCARPACKYYHIPVALPPAPVMAALASLLQPQQHQQQQQPQQHQLQQ